MRPRLSGSYDMTPKNPGRYRAHAKGRQGALWPAKGRQEVDFDHHDQLVIRERSRSDHLPPFHFVYAGETSQMPPISSLPAGAQKVHRNEKKTIAHEHGHIKSRFNNSICSNTDLGGAVIAWSPAGEVGLVSSREPTQQSSTRLSRRQG